MKWISRIFSRKKSLETTFDPEFHIIGDSVVYCFGDFVCVSYGFREVTNTTHENSDTNDPMIVSKTVTIRQRVGNPVLFFGYINHQQIKYYDNLLLTESQIEKIQREIHNAATFVKKERDTGGIEP